MKTKFTKEYVLANKGCYSEEQVNALPFDRNGEITIEKLHKVLPIKDFSWFLVRKCELTLEQKRRFALHCAKQVLPIFEKRYPNDNRVRACIEATEGYLNGTVTREELNRARYAAHAAAYAADAAAAADAAYAAAAYAADAAAYAAAYAAYAAAAADAAYAAAAYAADAAAYAAAAADAAYAAAAYAADAAAYSKSILKFVKDELK